MRKNPKIESKPKITKKALMLKVLKKLAPNIKIVTKDKEEEEEIIAPNE